jgi:hypothetical protein
MSLENRRSTEIRRERERKSFQEVEPHVQVPPKFLWIEPFYSNFLGF